MEATMSEWPFDLNKLVELCRQHGIRQMGVFGSVARGDADEQSDIDLLVSFSKRISLLQMVALERRLSDALGRKVDLITKDAISPYLWERIKSDVQVLYEAG
jgi:predicted nucleotidyltransferase